MKIKIEPYNKDWPNQFQLLKKEIQNLLQEYAPIVEHFGSTAVPGLSAKPIIDILVGIKDKNQFPHIVDLILQHPSYLYYKAFNEALPERRLFVKLKDEIEDSQFSKVLQNSRI